VNIREIRGQLLGLKRRLKVQFQVNGQDYFLTFGEDDSMLYVLAPTEEGVQRIPVYQDVPKYDRIGVLEKKRHKVVN